MKLQNIFYVVGVAFILFSVIYFAKEFIVNLPNSIKLILLIAGVVITFVIGEFLRSADK